MQTPHTSSRQALARVRLLCCSSLSCFQSFFQAQQNTSLTTPNLSSNIASTSRSRPQPGQLGVPCSEVLSGRPRRMRGTSTVQRQQLSQAHRRPATRRAVPVQAQAPAPATTQVATSAAQLVAYSQASQAAASPASASAGGHPAVAEPEPLLVSAYLLSWIHVALPRLLFLLGKHMLSQLVCGPAATTHNLPATTPPVLSQEV